MRTAPIMALLLHVCILCGLAPASASDSRGKPEPRRSPGCGSAASAAGRFETIVTQVRGKERTYHLRLPDGYDPDRAYPLIFRWHGRGGDGLSGGLDIEAEAGTEAIVAGADGQDRTWRANEDSADLAFFDDMLDMIEQNYCIDRRRIFSYGFSAGGFFTNFLACERGEVLRASASVSGGPGGSRCRGRVAAWFLHDVGDDAVPLALGEAARDRALKDNGCSTETIDEGEGCVRYAGCDSAPVVWCQSEGFGHDIRGDFAPRRVWRFFRSLQ